jgi:hypothetical protein
MVVTMVITTAVITVIMAVTTVIMRIAATGNMATGMAATGIMAGMVPGGDGGPPAGMVPDRVGVTVDVCALTGWWSAGKGF